MDSLKQDLLSAWRGLRHAPGFTALAVLVLAVGIGGNTAIFSVMDAALAHAAPFPQASRLVMIWESLPQAGWDQVTFSAPDYLNLKRRQTVYTAIAAYRNKNFLLSGVARPQRLTGTVASATLLQVLGARPLLGRWFTPQENQARRRVAVLSYGLWRRDFGGRRDVLGQSIELNRRAFTIIGVMPRHFQFPLRGPRANNRPAALWAPIAFSPAEIQGYGNMFNNSVIARLRPGVALAAAAAETEGIVHAFERQYPMQLRTAYPTWQLGAVTHTLQRAVTGRIAPVLLLLLGATGLVLLIACADVSSLLLARATARRREMALRTALGAPRRRLVQQMLAEGLLLALGGGAGGLLIAVWGTPLLIGLAPSFLPRAHAAALSPGVLAATLGLCLAATLVFALAPALAGTGAALSAGLRQGPRGGGLSRARHRALSGLVVAELALAMIVLAAAGLLLRSFGKLLATDPGFRPDQLVTLATDLPVRAYPNGARVRAFYRGWLAGAAALPGVRSAALATELPFAAIEHDVLHIPGRPEAGGAHPVVNVSLVEGPYFATLGAKLLGGRFFTPADGAGARPVAIVNQKLARRFWPGADAIGQQLRLFGATATVVGVVADMKNGPMRDPAEAEAFLSWPQLPDAVLTSPIADEFRSLHLIARTAGSGGGVLAELRGLVRRQDASLPVFGAMTMHGLIRQSDRPQRFLLWLFAAFALAAALLAAMGIYGVVAYAVAQRKPELGVRLALGATPAAVEAMVLRQAGGLAAWGIGLGLAAALILCRLLSAFLYGVGAADGMTYAAAAIVLAAVALLAAYGPARRAARTDPLTALRAD